VGGWAGAGPEVDDLRAALGRTADAYGKLAGASATGDASRYDAARKAIRRAERAVRRALDAVG
jgi:3-oxoacyl-(acyl-carrier-protein) synthase